MRRWTRSPTKGSSLDALERAVANIASDCGALIPEGMSIEFVADTSVRGRSAVFRDLIEYIECEHGCGEMCQGMWRDEQGGFEPH